MRYIYFIILISLFSSCWTGETVTRQEQIGYTPKPIIDSVTTSVLVHSTNQCDSLIRKAVSDVASYYINQQTNANDNWTLQSAVNLDSVKKSQTDSLSKILYYRIKKQLYVQPHSDSILVLFPVKEMRPWKLGEQIRLSVAWPSVALNVLLFIFFVVIIKTKF
jgi:hypothetical protein